MAGRPAKNEDNVATKATNNKTDMTKGNNNVSGTSKVEEVLKKINSGTEELQADNVNATERTDEAKKIAIDEEIPCKSLVYGGLTWISPKTNAHYRWNGIGDIEYIPFGELVTLNNTARQFLFRPLFVVQDTRAVQYFRLLPVYEKVARINDLEKVMNGSLPQIEKVIEDALTVNMRNLLVSKIRNMRKGGKLNNIDVIRLLEAKLGFNFSDDTPCDEAV